MSSQPMKFLFAGLGSIGQRHLRNLRTVLGESCEVFAYRSGRKDVVLSESMQVESAATMASKYGIREYIDLEEALAQKPDVTFVTNPSSLHVPVAVEAAKAGCHLFIEKPLSSDESGLEELTGIVARNKLVAMVGYQFRFHPCLRDAKKFMDEGLIGNVVSGTARIGEYLPNWHPYEDYRQGYAARSDLGGGALATQSHEIDYIMWLFGMPTAVFATGGHLSDLELDVEDTVNLQMVCSANGPAFPVTIQMDYVQWPPVRDCTIVGDRGKIVVDLLRNSLTLYQRAEDKVVTHQPENYDRNQLFLDQLNTLLSCVRGEMEPPVSLHEGRQNMRIIVGARESMETGKVVQL